MSGNKVLIFCSFKMIHDQIYFEFWQRSCVYHVDTFNIKKRKNFQCIYYFWYLISHLILGKMYFKFYVCLPLQNANWISLIEWFINRIQHRSWILKLKYRTWHLGIQACHKYWPLRQSLWVRWWGETDDRWIDRWCTQILGMYTLQL